MQQNKKNEKKSFRLTSDIVPKQYTIVIEPDLEAHIFSGKEEIILNIKKETKAITLHSKELLVSNVFLKQGGKQHKGKVTYNKKDETITCTFLSLIKKGKATLELSFTGILNNSMRGFYKSQYIVDGKEKTMATTQFEATDARRCIPCFDEPAQKASFKVSLIVPEGKHAISNMLPVSTDIHREGYNIVSFEETPIMSTYLLAFLVGDFEYLEKTTKNGVHVRIITTPGKKDQGHFALDVAIRCLDFYEKYFGIKYPLNTLDMIAVPDFESGAMENWGAITYRETALLIDEDHSSLSNKQGVAIVICHELAHQWFGNLVTMEWWNDLWLNEGFASYMEYVAVDALFPKWNIWSQFMFSDHNYALRLDGLSSTHPIDVPVHDPNHIGEIFDAISYSKGAALIRQLALFIGEKSFRDGLHYYLTKHSYKNTQTIHLWDAFERSSNKPVKNFMDVWTKKAGHPIVSFKEKNDVLICSQERFYIYSPNRLGGIKQNWPIPLSFRTDKKDSIEYLFNKKSLTINKPSNNFYKPNKNESGFYRVLYTESMLSKIAPQIQNGRLGEEDRLGVIRDLFAALEGGYIPAQVVLDFLLYYKEEKSYSIWIEICSGLRKISNIIDNKKDKEKFNFFVHSLLASIVDYIGTSPIHEEEETTPLLRNLILGTSGYFGDKKIIQWAQVIFKNKDKVSIDPDIRSVVYAIIARYGTDEEYGEIRSLYEKTTMHQEKIRLLQALGGFQKKTLIAKSLSYMLSKDVRLQDRIYLFSVLASEEESRKQTFVYMTTKWDSFKELAQARHMFGDFVKSFSGIKTKDDLLGLKKFFSNKKEGIEMALAQTIERISINIDFKKREEKNIVTWFEEYSKK